MAPNILLDPVVIITVTNLSFSIGCLYLLIELHSRRKKKKMKEEMTKAQFG